MMAEAQTQYPLASLQTISQARAALEARLVGIDNDLELTQAIGLLFIKRQKDLSDAFTQLQTLDQQQQQQYANQSHETLPPFLRDQLALIDKEFQEGHNGILGLKGLIDAQLPSIEIQPPQHEAPRSGSILAPSALPSSSVLPAQTITKPRRHKVVVPSAPSFNDPAFPVQIQEELLNQVRYWTSQAEMKEKLNQEYDLKITEQERIIDALNKQRRIREENDERQKEDQWNLELLNQELRGQAQDLQNQLSRALHENAKIQRSLATASEQVEQLKDKEEKAAGQLELTKSRHEQDMTTMRKHTTTIQREKSDLMKKLEDLNATLTIQQQKLAKKATLEAIALAQERELEELEREESSIEAPILIQAPPRILSNDELAPPTAISTLPSEPKMASLARETSFAHQQSIISELQSKLSKEISEKESLVEDKEQLLSEKEELVKMLADREETIETMRMEGAVPNIVEPALPLSSKSSIESRYGASDMHEGHDEYDYGQGVHHGLDAELTRRYSNAMLDTPVAGGLFAELAQANTSELKDATEYKDQEVMTEPIESWIHTLPGFAPAIVAATTAEVSDASTQEDGRKQVESIAVGTESSIDTTSSIASTTIVSETPKEVVDTATLTDHNDKVEPPVPQAVTVDNSTSTADLVAELVDTATLTDHIDKVEPPVPQAVTVDNSTSTADLVAAAELATKVAIEAAAQAAATEAIAKATAEAAAKAASEAAAIEAAKPAPVQLIDSATSTDHVTAADASTATDPISFRPASVIKEKASSSTHNSQLADIITRAQPGPKSVRPLESVSVNTPTITELEVASVHLSEITDKIHDATQDKASEPEAVAQILPIAHRKHLDIDGEAPIPRTTNSEIALGDERRHTCDLSQSMLLRSAASTTLADSAIPPVPAIPKDYYTATTVTRPANPAADGPEFRVSFGSAFGDATIDSVLKPYSSTTTEPVPRMRADVGYESELEEYALEQSQEVPQGILSPGRPSTGPPSSLLARAAARTSMGSELADMAHDHSYPNNGTLHHQYASDSTSMLDSPKESAHHDQLLPCSVPPRTSSVMSSYSSTEHMMPTGAAVISSTTRTAYTFNHSTSQVHVPSTSQSHFQHITDSSGASIGRSNKYRPSPNGSISSMSTDYGGGRERDRSMSVSSNYDGQGTTSTDPSMIQVITQTMIGDYLWKYTRRPTVMASVISEKRHRRYFWVHPYTKTMYWSLNNPAAEGSREQRAKSALIVAVFQITDDNVSSSNSELPNVSLLVQTSSRNLKLTAPTREKHDLWYQSLAYLLSRPSDPGGGTDTPTDNQTWSEVQAARGVASDTLLTIRNDKTVRKKSSFNRLHNIFGRSKEASPAGSPRGSGSALGSGLSSTSVNGGQHSSLSSVMVQTQPQHSQSALSSTGSLNASVIGYSSHMPSQGSSAVGGFGTVNGGPILSSSSSLRSRMTEQMHYGAMATDDDVDIDEEDDDDDEDDVLPEHIRQCCDGKHDIGSLHHH
ncbi:hypothetical protein BG006_010117 [Podila minutissima]|uniref:PH domain-containing protein n=1 Tax=Podila minutissima TaxID=64525 RepID=A0A9P5SRE9_9FUNG|nr:hypothetical protein BG006_010117 [Podila minutissima]